MIYKIGVQHWAFGGKCEVVAELELSGYASPEDACERAFFLTNTIDRAWFNNPLSGATELVRLRGERSTSVGDLMTVSTNDGDEFVFEVADCGFKRLVPLSE